MLKRLITVVLLAGCGRWPAPDFPAPFGAFSYAGVIKAMTYVAKHRFQKLDTNQDGFVDRFREWDGWDNDFLLADQNRDNKLTPAEYHDLMTSKLSVEQFQSISGQLFDRLDRNSDGRLDDHEWRQSGHTFSDRTPLADLPWQGFDMDGDSGLDTSEFEDAFAHHWARHGTD